VTPTGKATDHPDFESLQFLLGPPQTARADANTGCTNDRIALRHHTLRKRGHLHRKLRRGRIEDYLPHTRICDQSNRFAIDHHDFSAGGLCRQRTHYRRSDLPRAADYQDAKSHGAPLSLEAMDDTCSTPGLELREGGP
jgi:hypothetical protein